MGDDCRTVKQAKFGPGRRDTAPEPAPFRRGRGRLDSAGPRIRGGSVAAHQADDDPLDLHVLLASPDRREPLVRRLEADVPSGSR